MKKLPVILASLGMWFSMAPASMAVPSDGTTSSALITEAKGQVFKRGFIDWSKEQWGETEPAKKGDVLHEGMQVGTGEKSSAQIAWKYVTCRAWANSTYAIAPNQKLVYLSNGEMLFHLDKNRKDKDNYCIWTNLLQARVRGTTVLVQATPEISKITVLEGTVDVLNKLDHSVVRIKPGVVYTVQSKTEAMQREIGLQTTERTVTTSDAIEKALNSPAVVSNVTTNNSGGNGTAGSIANAASVARPVLPGGVSTIETIATPQSLTNIVSSKQALIPLFDDVKSTTSLLVANVDSLLVHPLVVGLDSELSSLPLVKSALSELPAVFHEGNVNLADAPLRSLGTAATDIPLLNSAAEVLRVPTKTSYDVGPSVGTMIKVAPVALALFPPQSIIGSRTVAREGAFVDRIAGGLKINQAGHRVLSLHDPLFRLPVQQSLISVQLPGGANLPGATSIGNTLSINNSVLANRSLGIVGLTGANSSSIIAGNTLLNGSILNNVIARGGVVNSVTGVTGLTGVTGVTGANGLVGQLGGTVNQTLGGVGNIVTGLGGTLNGTLNGVGGIVGGNLGGTINNLGGTLNGTLGGVGGAVNGLGNGLGGLLGGH